MEKVMDKTLVIKFPNISTLSELHDKMNKTKVLRKLEKFPANLFLHDVGDFFQYSVFSLDDQGGLDIKNKKCERQLFVNKGKLLFRNELFMRTFIRFLIFK